MSKAKRIRCLLIGSLLLFASCGQQSKANGPTLIRVTSDCRNADYWVSGQGRVRVVYVDANTRNEVSYFFLCDQATGLLIDPVEEKRYIQP